MNLWIKSQNEERIMKVDFLQIIHNEEDEKLPYYINASYEYLGAYKTKERAKEVLAEIEERISLLEAMKLAEGSTTALVAFNRSLGEDKIKGLSYPYQMPKE